MSWKTTANYATSETRKCGCHTALKCKNNLRSIIIRGGGVMKGRTLTLLSLSRVSWNLSGFKWSTFPVPASPQRAGSSLITRPTWAPVALVLRAESHTLSQQYLPLLWAKSYRATPLFSFATLTKSSCWVEWMEGGTICWGSTLTF